MTSETQTSSARQQTPPGSELDPLLPSSQLSQVESRPGDSAAGFIAYISVLILAGFTWSLVLTHNPRSLGYFAFHPPLQTLALVCFVFGVMTLQRTTLANPEGKKKGLARHQIWMAMLALPLITAGAIIMIINKASHGANHFTTWHAKFGLVTWVWLLAQGSIGAATVLFNGAAFGGQTTAKKMYKYHRISGYLVLTMLLTTVYLAGAWSEWAIYVTSKGQRVVVYAVLPIVILASVIWRVRPGKMKFM